MEEELDAAMDAARASMREWWMNKQSKKEEEAVIAAMDESRAAMRQWWINKQEIKDEEKVIATMDEARAAMRQWWLEKQAEAVVTQAEPKKIEEAEKVVAEAENPKEVIKVVAEETIPEKEENGGFVAPVAWVLTPEEEIIQRELAIERARNARKRAQKEKELIWEMDQGRKAMREWWLKTWSAKKRSMGWGGNPPCWVLSPTEGSAFKQDIVISGEGVIIGSQPTVEAPSKITPIAVDLPTVSTTHVRIYGKDAPAGPNKYVREYYVVDLASLSGTFLNKTRLRPNVPVKLSPGDTIKLGDERAKLIITKP